MTTGMYYKIEILKQGLRNQYINHKKDIVVEPWYQFYLQKKKKSKQ